MKRIALILIMVLFAANMAEAQRREMRRADRALNRGELAEAKEAIDAAVLDESTRENAEAWLTRAKVYLEITMAEDETLRESLDQNPVEIADKSLHKAMELDKGNNHILETQQLLLILSELTFNEGVRAFNVENWLLASDFFLRSFNLAEDFGTIDTTTLYNSGLAAELGRDFDRAEKLYLQLVDMDYDQPYLFSSLSNINLFRGDTLAGTRFLNMGRERFPDDLNLIFNLANVYIFTGNTEQAKEILDVAISRDPDNPNLHFALAANFDRMSQDTTYTADERQSAFNRAEESYRRAIELDPDYFDAIYNLGVLYFNEGVRIYEYADSRLRETQNFREYEQNEARFRESWLRAQPYLERARMLIDEDDINYEVVIISLLQLYARTNQLDKMQEMEDEYQKYFGVGEE